MNTEAPITLIQLISEQTMPNLLPLLRLKPAHAIHLVTPSTAARSRFVLEAAADAGVLVEGQTVHLSAMPGMAETCGTVVKAIEQTRAQGGRPVVNITGGTKLMSIGAFYAAVNPDHAAPTLYVDTGEKRFVDGNTDSSLPADSKLSGLLQDDYSYASLQHLLTVPIIARANGQDHISQGLDWRPYAPLALHLLGQYEQEEACHFAVADLAAAMSKARASWSPQALLSLLDRPVVLPEVVIPLGLQAGILRQLRDGSGALSDSTRGTILELNGAGPEERRSHHFKKRFREAAASIEHNIKFFMGTWWEVCVADAAHRSGVFHDIRWSADAGSTGKAVQEQDVLAVDGVEAVIISCKRGGQRTKLLAELDRLSSRARHIGGHFTRRFLAVYLEPPEPVGKRLKQRAAELGIRLLFPQDLVRHDAFSRRKFAG